ncbi:basic helix-loop-helix domain-containing protein [Paludisphaera rhizosphaerae]|uniref:hypothetical protein n=1 Tax=Paludisphaera rhizosphaerae TaxID=2711216 RepID=UPI0013EA2E09|nr:hypothetical protein [Paludisphaera rhizosphaerae]
MLKRPGLTFGLCCVLWSMLGVSARAQWGFPGGFGNWGWGGWGGATAAGDQARGLGAFAQGAGFYNKQSAIADSINTDTVIRWNEYVHESQRQANQAYLRRMQRRRENTNLQLDQIRKRLRDNPEPRDVTQGDALNVALEEINDPRVYAKALRAAQVRIGADVIREIPFRYNAAAITVGLHQLATGDRPAPLLRPEFTAHFEAIRSLDQKILDQVEKDDAPDPATVRELLEALYKTEDTALGILPPNSIELKQADRYLKALHGLIAMLKAPNIESFVSGVGKRPDATLGDLLSFMNAFNLRFGVASTPRQREVFNVLYRQLLQLRDEVNPPGGFMAAVANAPGAMSSWVQSFFTGMSYDDLRKAAPRPR